MTNNKKKTGWLAAAALVAGNMIGTGVFISLGFQLADLPPNGVIALLWTLGGVAAFCGALEGNTTKRGPLFNGIRCPWTLSRTEWRRSRTRRPFGAIQSAVSWDFS